MIWLLWLGQRRGGGGDVHDLQGALGPGGLVPQAPEAGLRGRARALLVNAGNANAFTGEKGDLALQDCASAAARQLGCTGRQVMIGSTGVIGLLPDAGKITRLLPVLGKNLKPDAWQAGAGAIRTTDTFAKGASATATIDGVTVRINGIAKGSGMIAPDMATMLAYVSTTPPIPADVLHALLRRR